MMSFNNTEWDHGTGYSLTENGWKPVTENVEYIRKPTEEDRGLPICRFRKQYGDKVVELEFRHDRKYTILSDEWEIDIKSLNELEGAVEEVLGE